jgi:hypothetical protein
MGRPDTGQQTDSPVVPSRNDNVRSFPPPEITDSVPDEPAAIRGTFVGVPLLPIRGAPPGAAISMWRHGVAVRKYRRQYPNALRR